MNILLKFLPLRVQSARSRSRRSLPGIAQVFPLRRSRFTAQV